MLFHFAVTYEERSLKCQVAIAQAPVVEAQEQDEV
jgi:hypothetical protein